MEIISAAKKSKPIAKPHRISFFMNDTGVVLPKMLIGIDIARLTDSNRFDPKIKRRCSIQTRAGSSFS